MARRKNTTTRRTPDAPVIPSTGKHFRFDPETRDYALYLDGQLVGFKSNPEAAEAELDRLQYEHLSRAA